MIDNGDPIALALYEQYDRLLMPNSRLNKMEAVALLDYIEAETQRLAGGGARLLPAAMSSNQTAAADLVAVMDAWVREADVAAKANAGYFTLVNVGSEDLTLVAVESDAFSKVEMHEMAMVEGLMKMQRLEELLVPAGGSVSFEPGGKHLMLMGPQRDLRAGDALELTLRFKSGRQQNLPIKVVKQ